VEFCEGELETQSAGKGGEGMSQDRRANWVERAAKLPVGFAQVREDALLDVEVVERIGRENVRVIMIASGGCTAAALAACGKVSEIQLVDANAAQMELCRMKLKLLEELAPRERLGALLKSGMDEVGRYEMVFAELRKELAGHVEELKDVLEGEKSLTTELGRAMDEAFERVMSLENLVKLFGEGATGNARQPFSRHFAQRTRWAIENLPTKDNPYLWQMLMGRFPEGTVYPWLSAERPKKMPEVRGFVGPMDQALEKCGEGFDFVHLSNICDWVSKAEARTLLSLAWSALEPGGYVLIRHLNSTLNIRLLGEKFEWLIDHSEEMHRRDRSFFYRQLHLGRRL
jgi:S-adenosylmethionine-diacylglycerol 3-amino-3-carboxypropyl transferase